MFVILFPTLAVQCQGGGGGQVQGQGIWDFPRQLDSLDKTSKQYSGMVRQVPTTHAVTDIPRT